MTLLECGIIFGGIPAGAISRKGGLIWGIPVYFAGPKKKFRVRYDRIVSFEPYDDGFGIMRDAQTAKPQMFRTGDGWFPYNLATNLAQNLG